MAQPGGMVELASPAGQTVDLVKFPIKYREEREE